MPRGGYSKSADQSNAFGQSRLCFGIANRQSKATRGGSTTSAIATKMDMVVDQDYEQAASWSRKSAERGNAPGQNGLGGFCYDGQGVDQGHKQIVFWYRKSAEHTVVLAAPPPASA